MISDNFLNFVQNRFGNWHHPHGDASTNEIITTCPACGGKDKLYINPVKGLFRCQKCGESGRLIRLLSDLAGVSMYEAYHLIEGNDVPSLSQFNEVLNRLAEPPPPVRMDASEYLPDFVDLTHPSYTHLSRYVTDRGFSIEYARTFGVCLAVNGLFYDRVVLPVYEHGRLLWFQARAVDPDRKPKYLNPRGSKGECLFNYEHAYAYGSQGWPVWITEGAFNAMAVGYSGIALFGKTMSQVQELKIRSIPNLREIVIALDHGAETDATVIYNRLKPVIPQITILRFPDQRDLNDYYKAHGASVVHSLKDTIGWKPGT